MKIEIEITEDAWVVENAKQSNTSEFEIQVREAILSISAKIVQTKLAQLANKNGSKTVEEKFTNQYKNSTTNLERETNNFHKQAAKTIEFDLTGLEFSEKVADFNVPGVDADDFRKAGGKS